MLLQPVLLLPVLLFGARVYSHSCKLEALLSCDKRREKFLLFLTAGLTDQSEFPFFELLPVWLAASDADALAAAASVGIVLQIPSIRFDLRPYKKANRQWAAD